MKERPFRKQGVVMKRFVFIVPRFFNMHLKKDVGMIPYFMSKNYGYESWIVGYKNEDEYPSYRWSWQDRNKRNRPCC